ncbi:hypothetical protein [Amycolatopsis sp. WQ 127309]|uniref:hypothetical protein n=1 Tax=Amycolatopsis sp. WQ 127309 TaxID=2932773 RepID=UPI001FF1CED2|nr:hypothetical protein [Amycolatopsis sp. WQ 127309]UOZ09703.1 hypothetical protein MUY22_16085 [Amycolatopsis sp. WQ 127309]
MSSAEERYRAAISTMDAAAREQDEQRGLRERRVAEAETQAREGLKNELGAAQKYAEHMDELNKRKQSAGGWATEKTLADKGRESLMQFGGEDEDSTPTNSFPAAPALAATAPRPEPVTAPVPAPEPPPPAPEAQRPRGRHARPVEDEDDFSSTSWLV